MEKNNAFVVSESSIRQKTEFHFETRVCDSWRKLKIFELSLLTGALPRNIVRETTRHTKVLWANEVRQECCRARRIVKAKT